MSDCLSANAQNHIQMCSEMVSNHYIIEKTMQCQYQKQHNDMKELCNIKSSVIEQMM